jgi:phi13 family phage major tail protein
MISNNNGYSGDLELALVPEEFLKDILKETEDANGVLVENKDVEPEHFALLFEFTGDQRKIRHCLYYCSATRPSMEGDTKEDKTSVKTEKLSLTVSPLPSGVVKVKTGTNTSEAIYNDWYKAVYEPKAPTTTTTTTGDTTTGA